MTVKKINRTIVRDPQGKRLTPNELRVYEAAADLLGQKPWGPTVQEIADFCGMHASTVGACLGRLATKGMITREPNKQRSVELVEAQPTAG